SVSYLPSGAGVGRGRAWRQADGAFARVAIEPAGTFDVAKAAEKNGAATSVSYPPSGAAVGRGRAWRQTDGAFARVAIEPAGALDVAKAAERNDRAGLQCLGAGVAGEKETGGDASCGSQK